MTKLYIYSGLAASFLLSACSGPSVSGKISPKAKKHKLEALERAPGAPSEIEMEFVNNQGKVKVRINPNDQDYHLVFKGKRSTPIPNATETSHNVDKKTQRDTLIIQQNGPAGSSLDSLVKNSEMPLDSTSDKMTKRLLQLLHEAQSAFYDKDYEKCHQLLEQSLVIKKTAEAYAMMGSLNYVQNRSGLAVQFWKYSLAINPEQADIKKAIESIEGEAKL